MHYRAISKHTFVFNFVQVWRRYYSKTQHGFVWIMIFNTVQSKRDMWTKSSRQKAKSFWCSDIMSDHIVKLVGQCPMTDCYFQHWSYMTVLKNAFLVGVVGVRGCREEWNVPCFNLNDHQFNDPGTLKPLLSQTKNIQEFLFIYRIYLIKHPGHLLGPWEWALIRGWALRVLNFHNFQQVISLFCNKTINNNKTWRCTKAEF